MYIQSSFFVDTKTHISIKWLVLVMSFILMGGWEEFFLPSVCKKLKVDLLALDNYLSGSSCFCQDTFGLPIIKIQELICIFVSFFWVQRMSPYCAFNMMYASLQKRGGFVTSWFISSSSITTHTKFCTSSLFFFSMLSSSSSIFIITNVLHYCHLQFFISSHTG